MVFRKGGKIPPGEEIRLKGQPLKIVNSAKYLGITLQTTTRSYRIHIQERATAATRAMFTIKNIQALSLDSAMHLFRAKIIPILSYGIELIWEKLSKHDMNTLEKVKARYMKLALGVSKFTPSRLTYEMCRETFLLDDLRLSLILPPTTSFLALKEELKRKKEDIWPDFYATDAMTDRSWTRPNQELRHVLTRLATHGYHHKICKTSHYHSPNEDCVCSLCEQQCDRYHITKCKHRTRSLKNYSRE